jgi:DNA invertase Pin-like site-specific DNA recombinase
VTFIGYARCSSLGQENAVQRAELVSLGVPEPRIYTDEGYPGTNSGRPGLDQALAAVQEGDTFVVTKLDRLAGSVPDALDLMTRLSSRGVKFAIGGRLYDWEDPSGRMFFSVLVTIAEFEGALIQRRRKERMSIARSKGTVGGRQPKLSPAQQNELLEVHARGEHSIEELCELFGVSRSSVYRALARAGSSSSVSRNSGGRPRPRRSIVPGASPPPISLPPNGPRPQTPRASASDRAASDGGEAPGYVAEAYWEMEALADTVEDCFGLAPGRAQRVQSGGLEGVGV